MRRSGPSAALCCVVIALSSARSRGTSNNKRSDAGRRFAATTCLPRYAAGHDRARRSSPSGSGLRLSARLPVDLRARGRGARRSHHRPRARRRGQRLHGRRDLRQGRALRRARPPSRPPAASAAPHGPKGLGRVRSRSPGTTRSISSPRSSSRAEQRHGAQAVWPYYYAGTMGLVMRDGINRLRHAKKYSGFHSTICVNPA